MSLDNKASLRQAMLKTRDSLAESERIRRSQIIVQKIQQHPWYQNARIVGLYAPIGSEVNLLALCLDKTKTFGFPKITDFANIQMEICLDTGEFTKGRFGLSEPVGPIIPKKEIDLLLVPGVAFSSTGVRIGYGKGFYDVYLEGYHQKTIGVGYGIQLVKSLPANVWDRQMDQIVTDQEELCIQPLL
jgi:5-formyltetrahydrofolate cyclo-ligase